MTPPRSINSLSAQETLFLRSFSADIVIQDRRWHCYVPSLEKFIQRVLRVCHEYGTLPQTLILSTDRAVRILNGRYRRSYKPTNVLTFTLAPHASQSDYHVLGDIFLAFETIRREAYKTHRPFAHHLAHLIIHGSLHLAGYDHHHPGEAQRMEMLESFLLSRLHIPNPWKPRS